MKSSKLKKGIPPGCSGKHPPCSQFLACNCLARNSLLAIPCSQLPCLQLPCLRFLARNSLLAIPCSQFLAHNSLLAIALLAIPCSFLACNCLACNSLLAIAFLAIPHLRALTAHLTWDPLHLYSAREPYHTSVPGSAAPSTLPHQPDLQTPQKLYQSQLGTKNLLISCKIQNSRQPKAGRGWQERGFGLPARQRAGTWHRSPA